MENRLENYIVILLLVLVWIPCSTIGMKAGTSENTEGLGLSSNTELNISNVLLFYRIDSTGEYLCHFTLKAFGNSLTAVGSVQCVFNISDPNIEDLDLMISDALVEVDKTTNNHSSIIIFSTHNKNIPVGYPFTIQGSFRGKYRKNVSSIYTFTLGLDWGTTVGFQQTIIQLGRYQYTPISIQPDPHIIEYKSLGITEFQWNEMLVRGFNALLEIHLRNSPNTFLIVDHSPWNATIGQTVHVPLYNNGTFELNISVITPNWISTNVSNFILFPNQKIVLAFTVNSRATIGMNDTIQIIVWQLRKPIIIHVTILDGPPENGPQTGLFSFLVVSSIFTSFLAIGLSYYKRDSVKEFFNHRKKEKDALAIKTSISSVYPRDLNLSWESIRSRWKPILPDHEFQVLEILFNQGIINQQTIADQLGVSAMTMSRIISRLEAKQLLVRERLGMSNMIKLNIDHL